MKLSKWFSGLFVIGAMLAGTGAVVQASCDVPVVASSFTYATALQPYTYQIEATNNPTSYSAWPIPPGLVLNTATGLFTGSPTYSGRDWVNLYAYNQCGQSGPGELTIQVANCQNIPVINSPTHAIGVVGQPFAYQITATNNPTGFGAVGLPPGLQVNRLTGLISGTPLTPGTSDVRLSAQNLCEEVTAELTLQVIGITPVGTTH